MWPFCKQPMYASAMPTMFNATILNGMAVTGRVSKAPAFEATDEGGTHLHIEMEHSELLWPWSGYLALFIRVRDSGKEFTGNASGVVRFEVTSPPRAGSDQEQVSAVELPIKVGCSIFCAGIVLGGWVPELAGVCATATACAGHSSAVVLRGGMLACAAFCQAWSQTVLHACLPWPGQRML